MTIQRKNFEKLTEIFTTENQPQLPKSVLENMEHGRQYEPTAREMYIELMKTRLQRTVQVRETGFVVQPSLFWLGASPDGLVRDGTVLGLIEIKCPKTKRNMTPAEMMSDQRFYVEMKDDVPSLKKNHSYGYYSQIQIAMGLC